jgi:site-specific recombinase XerD
MPQRAGFEATFVYVREMGGFPRAHAHPLSVDPHHAASCVNVAGTALVEVQHDLGHTNIRTTSIYSHATPVMRRKSADKLQELLEAQRG